MKEMPVATANAAVTTMSRVDHEGERAAVVATSPFLSRRSGRRGMHWSETATETQLATAFAMARRFDDHPTTDRGSAAVHRCKFRFPTLVFRTSPQQGGRRG